MLILEKEGRMVTSRGNTKDMYDAESNSGHNLSKSINRNMEGGEQFMDNDTEGNPLSWILPRREPYSITTCRWKTNGSQ